MNKNIQSIRGMHDCLPSNIKIWQKIENILKKILTNYGFNEIRTPIIEQTLLFSRAIGNITDVIKKEMYTFNGKDGDSLTLRPENTASCVRAIIQHGLLRNKQQRLWYLGPMFRYERPQKGRYRQFHQLGAEVFGLAGPEIDAELIIMTSRWWRELGINNNISLELNSIGTLKAQKKYCEILIDFFKKYENKLDIDSRRQLSTNPLRIFDSKNFFIKKILNKAPLLINYIDEDSKKHFIKLCKLLDAVGIQYKINQHLVRGLDYYNYTVFEWVTNTLGSQNTVCAGGRYDGLVQQLGGVATNAIGFAMGMERIVLLVQQLNPNFITKNYLIDVYLIACNKIDYQEILILSEKIRNNIPNLKLIIQYSSNLKKQLIRAYKNQVKFAIILIEDEYKFNKVIIKDLNTGKQEKIYQENVSIRLTELLR